MRSNRCTIIGATLSALLCSAALLLPHLVRAQDITGPKFLIYEGHLLSSTGGTLTSTHTFRFSWWQSTDFLAGDVTGAGAINTGASNYLGWNEAHTTTPNSDGYFALKLGSLTAFPSLTTFTTTQLENLHLQVEVKLSTDPDTSYEVLDISPTDASVERSPISSVPFAFNADTVDNRHIGTASGSVPILGPGGVFNSNVFPTTNNSDFSTIDADNSVSTGATLYFGTGLGNIHFNTLNNRFDINDNLHVTGTLSASGLLVIESGVVFKSTVSLGGVTYTFPDSDGPASGKVLATNGAGQLVWTEASSTGLSEGAGDNRYVEKSGDSMTGSLTIGNGGTLGVSGSIITNNNLTINSNNTAADAVLTFGNDATPETIRFSNANELFEFSDDVHTTGNLSASGALSIEGAIRTKDTLTINADNSATDAVLTFGNDAAAETVTFSNTNEHFVFSDDVHAVGNLTTSGTLTVENTAVFKSTVSLGGVTYTFPDSDGPASGKVLATNGAGQLVWTEASSTGLSEGAGDNRYVNASGDAMTGNLTIGNGSLLAVSGAILSQTGITLNSHNAAADAVLTFGNDSGPETLRYADGTNRFEFSEELYVDGNLTVNGLVNGIDLSSLSTGADSQLRVTSGAGLNINISGGNYRINGTTTNYAGGSSLAITDAATNYVYFTSTGLTIDVHGFPSNRSVIRVAEVVAAGGSVSTITDSKVLTSDDRERTINDVFHPQFNNAMYLPDGSSNIGRLKVDRDGSNRYHYYSWSAENAALQDYDVVLRVTLPDDFISWEATPLSLDYQTSAAASADNALDVSVFDTAGAAVTLAGASANLASTTWTTGNITYTGTPTWTPGAEFTIHFKLSARSSNQARLGTVRLNYNVLRVE